MNGMDVTLVYPEKHLMELLFTPEFAQAEALVYLQAAVFCRGCIRTEVATVQS